jgi:hypothetical protein
MAIALIPFEPSLNDYDMDLVLNGMHYSMHVYWNDRDTVLDADGNTLIDGAWYFDLSDASGNPLIYGVKIVLGAFLGKLCQDPLFTAGSIVVMDTSGANQDAGFDDLGARVQGYYIPSQDLMANIDYVQRKASGQL